MRIFSVIFRDYFQLIKDEVVKFYFKRTYVQQIRDEIERKRGKWGCFKRDVSKFYWATCPHVAQVELATWISFPSLSLSFSISLSLFPSSSSRFSQPNQTKKKIPDNHHRAISLGRSTHAAILSSSLLLPRLRSSSYPEPKLRARHSSQDRARDRREPPRAPPARRHR